MAGGMCGGDMFGRGHAWQGACVAGGVHEGACVVGVCMAGGMHGLGTCMAGGGGMAVQSKGNVAVTCSEGTQTSSHSAD